MSKVDIDNICCISISSLVDAIIEKGLLFYKHIIVQQLFFCRAHFIQE